MVSRRAESSESDEVSCLRVSSLVSEYCTRHTSCRFNDSSLGKGLSLDVGSARSISVPGLYLIVMSYPCILSSIRWSLSGAAVRFFKWIMGLVIRLHCEFPAKYVGVKFLTSNNNGKQLTLNICVPFLIVCECSGWECNNLAFWH